MGMIFFLIGIILVLLSYIIYLHKKLIEKEWECIREIEESWAQWEQRLLSVLKKYKETNLDPESEKKREEVRKIIMKNLRRCCE